MTEAEKPLHVKVAEALGWIDCHRIESVHGLSEEWYGLPSSDGTPPREIPCYDTDWSATGPLIEQLRLMLGWISVTNTWRAEFFEPQTTFFGRHADGSTPLLAVCNLILALAEADKLPKETH